MTTELSEVSDRVRLIITLRLAGRDMMIRVAGGWHTHFKVLATEQLGSPAPGFWKHHTVLEAEYQHLP